MFYIDDFNRDENVSFESAVQLITSYGQKSSLLENMQYMRDRLTILVDMENDEDEFFHNWSYEINAFNKVFSEMHKLFS